MQTGRRRISWTIAAIASAIVVVCAARSVAPATADGQPDLIVTGISTAPALPAPGESVEVTVTVQNVADTCVGCSTFWVDFYKSQPTAPAPGQSGWFSCQKAPLAGGATADCTGTVSYSSTNTYQMWAQVDTFSSIAEADETNNVFGPQDLHVAPHPELVVLSITANPSSPEAGQPVDITVMVRNDGPDCTLCQPFLIDFYKGLLAAPGPAQSGDLTCTDSVPPHATAVTCADNVVYPLAGNFQMWAQVDRTNAVTEFNDSNNVFGPQPISVFSDVDGDGVPDASDNCPGVSNSGQANADGDAFGDACDACPATADPAACADDDNDAFTDVAEAGSPLCANAANDDSFDDAVVNDGCPGGPAQAGAYSEAQFKIGTGPLDSCGLDGWPLDFVSGGIFLSTNRVKIDDLNSFLVPRRLDTNPGDPNFDSRWDLSPGRGVFTDWINIADINTLLAGTTAVPPMLGSTRAFDGPSCPFPP